MFDPNNDRLDYGKVLAPPDGFKLDFAIGTTYSLDLDALVGACIALGLSEDTDSDLMKNPICLLEALRVTGDRIALLCEGGQIHMPGNITSLYILLEKMVFQVATQKRREIAGYPSFHPKLWLIRYANEAGTPLYRVIVLSRNLTFDRSWDITFCMDGTRQAQTTTKNDPLKDMLTYLARYVTDEDKQNKIKEISRELSHINFELDSNEFYDYEFIPVGVRSKSDISSHLLFSKDEIKEREKYDELFIMSPFLSDGVIKGMRNKCRSDAACVLITRAMSLEKLRSAECNSFEIYTMRDAVIDGEDSISEDDTDRKKQDIHAKVYMARKYPNSELYLGSLNASHRALSGNIEFVIKLCAKNRHLNLKKLTASLFGTDEKKNPFRRATLENRVADKEQEKLNLLDGIIKDVYRLAPAARVVPRGELYDVTVTFAPFDTEFQISVAPLLSSKTAPLSESILFSSLNLTQLSEFYKISVFDGERTVSRMIMIPTEGIPEEREKAVVSSELKDSDCFYRYIAFLLGDSYILSAMENSRITADGHSDSLKRIRIPSLYEKMLQTAASAPERFNEIDHLIRTVSSDGVVPEDFEKLYYTFKKAVRP